MPDSAITKTIDLTASSQTVFTALTDPEQIVRYYPITSAECGTEVGGRFVLQGAVNGEPFTDHGVIEAFDPGRRFRYNYWSTNHGRPDLPENRMVVDYALEETAPGCRLSLTHSNLPSDEWRTMMDGVWDFLLGALAAHVEATTT